MAKTRSRSQSKIGIRIDDELATRVLTRAAKLAKSDSALPAQWLEIAKATGDSPRRVDTVVLGCALLARACDERADLFVVKLGVSTTGYDMRGLAERVLLPLKFEY